MYCSLKKMKYTIAAADHILQMVPEKNIQKIGINALEDVIETIRVVSIPGHETTVREGIGNDKGSYAPIRSE